MKLIFFGTPDFAVPVLEFLHAHHEIVLVVSGDNSPISDFAKKNGLKTMAELSTDDILSLKPDIMVVAAYGKVLPAELVNSIKTLNIHPSLLPKLRGPTPTQTALAMGLKETGVSIMVLDEQIDHGPILARQRVFIDDADTYLTLEPKLFKLGAELLTKIVPDYLAGKLKPQSQNHDEATYTKILKKEDGRVDWKKSAEEIFNQYRAYVRWPGIFTFFKKRPDLKNPQGRTLGKIRLKLIEIEKCATPSVAHKAGEVFTDDAKNLYVACTPTKSGGGACREGAVKIKKLQPENSKILSPAEFLNGYKEILGQIL